MKDEIDGQGRVEVVRADAARLGELEPIWRSLSDHHAELTPCDLPVRPSEEGWPIRQERYERSLEEGATLFIAQAAGRAIGFALANLKSAPVNLEIDEILDVETVAVLPGSRGAGVGRALMEAVYEMADAIGSDHLEVAVRTANAGALQFYERQGFTSLYVTMVARRESVSK